MFEQREGGNVVTPEAALNRGKHDEKREKEMERERSRETEAWSSRIQWSPVEQLLLIRPPDCLSALTPQR